jgi:hypothetical protein
MANFAEHLGERQKGANEKSKIDVCRATFNGKPQKPVMTL